MLHIFRREHGKRKRDMYRGKWEKNYDEALSLAQVIGRRVFTISRQKMRVTLHFS